MSYEHLCGDPAALAGYVYDECEAEEREAMSRHLTACRACAEEVAALRATREQLAAWTPPQAALGFRIVAAEATPAPVGVEAPRVAPFAAAKSAPRWNWAAVPAWAQTAAAVLLFACGAAVAALMNLEIRYDAAGVSVRTGWQQPAAESAAPAAPATAVAISDEVIARRVRNEIRRVQAEEGGKGPVGAGVREADAASAPASAEAMMRRMRSLIAESEQRQQRELALRLAQAVRDVDLQRRADLARIESTVVPMEGVTREEIQQQRRILNYLMNVSQTR
jgi:anti-sigma factor RsiW